ncbi:MAG: DUF6056 family protein [Flavobacteriaceae bacterium]
MFKKNKIRLYILAVLIATVLAFVIHFFTPLHSDDFSYKMRGLDLGKQWEHYLTWSGRLVANLISPLILLIKNKALIAIVQSLGLIALLHYVSQLPEIISDKKSKSPNLFAFILITSLFWLYHPALGQAIFWITGSANYMWTSLIICAYLIALLNYYYKEKFSYALPFLALIAGCTNENAVPIIIGFTFLLFVSKTYINKKIDITLGITFILNAIGGVFLILSPGNQARLDRLESWHGVNWRGISFMDKLGRFDSNYWEYLKYPVMFLVFLYIIIYLLQPIKIFNKDKKISSLSISVIFALGSFASDFMMFLSPQYPPRSMSGAFLFLLIAISFALYNIVLLSNKNVQLKHLYIVCASALLLLFGKEYFTKIFPMYNSAFQQNKVQLAMIKEFQEQGIKEVKIPRIHFESNYQVRIIFDLYEEPSTYAKYYGFDKVTFYSVNFDFSKIRESNSIIADKNLITEGGLKNVYMYSTHARTHFAIELSKEEVEALKGNYKMFFHVFKNTFNNFDIGVIKPVIYNDRYFITHHIDFKATNIRKINLGYFDANNWKTKYAELSIDLKQ